MHTSKSCRKKDKTTEKLGGDGTTIHEARRKDVSGILERMRKLSAKEMSGKGCRDSLKKVVLERLNARDLKRENAEEEIKGVYNQPGIMK